MGGNVAYQQYLETQNQLAKQPYEYSFATVVLVIGLIVLLW